MCLILIFFKTPIKQRLHNIWKYIYAEDLHQIGEVHIPKIKIKEYVRKGDAVVMKVSKKKIEAISEEEGKLELLVIRYTFASIAYCYEFCTMNFKRPAKYIYFEFFPSKPNLKFKGSFTAE